MNVKQRAAFISEIAKLDENIGKTGMMKILYLLQAICHVPLGYDFEIYTYGPYCQTVMNDIEYAEFVGYIKVAQAAYPNGMNGYQISTQPPAANLLKEESNLIGEYSTAISNIITFFGHKKAKELELYSTIVFVATSFSDNNWKKSKEEICNTVRKIKPHFSQEIIFDTYDDLVKNHFIEDK